MPDTPDHEHEWLLVRYYTGVEERSVKSLTVDPGQGKVTVEAGDYAITDAYLGIDDEIVRCRWCDQEYEATDPGGQPLLLEVV